MGCTALCSVSGVTLPNENTLEPQMVGGRQRNEFYPDRHVPRLSSNNAVRFYNAAITAER